MRIQPPPSPHSLRFLFINLLPSLLRLLPHSSEEGSRLNVSITLSRRAMPVIIARNANPASPLSSFPAFPLHQSPPPPPPPPSFKRGREPPQCIYYTLSQGYACHHRKKCESSLPPLLIPCVSSSSISSPPSSASSLIQARKGAASMYLLHSLAGLCLSSSQEMRLQPPPSPHSLRFLFINLLPSLLRLLPHSPC